MNFFRCQSRWYPYVQAATIWKQKIKHLVLRFWGNEKFPSVAVPFEIKDEQAEKSKRSEDDIMKLEGHYFKHDNDEEKIKITHKNCKFIDSSPPPVADIQSSLNSNDPNTRE